MEEQRQAAWYAGLDPQSQDVLRRLLEECAELSGLGFFTLIDGVGGDCEGAFETVHVSDAERTVLNPENSEMLHDLFSGICEEERRQSG